MPETDGPISAAIAWARAASRPEITTDMPSPASRSASARPMPDVPPRMTAVPCLLLATPASLFNACTPARRCLRARRDSRCDPQGRQVMVYSQEHARARRKRLPSLEDRPTFTDAAQPEPRWRTPG